MADPARYDGWATHRPTVELAVTIRAKVESMNVLKIFEDEERYNRLRRYTKKQMGKFLEATGAPAPSEACDAGSVREYLILVLQLLKIRACVVENVFFQNFK